MTGETTYIWMDGELKLWEEAKIHVMSHGLHYGSGFFEGIKCYATDTNPVIFRLQDHMQRLHASADIYRMPIPYDVDTLVKAVIDIVRVNRLKECYIRPIAFYGYDTLGVHPRKCPVHVAIATFNWGTYLGESALEKGIRATISPWRKFHSSSLPTAAKASGQYLNSLLAVTDAHEKGFDEAILLNEEGNIAEGSGQNIFIVKNNEVYTNSEHSSILMGVTRDTVISLLRDLGIPIHIGKLSIGQLFSSDEAFFTGTASEITPVVEIDTRTIGTGRPGPISKQIQSLYLDIVRGKKEEYHSWLTFIE